jgi:hypothetical protein
VILKLSTKETALDPRVNKQLFALNKLYPIIVKEEPAEPETKLEPEQASEGINWVTDDSEEEVNIF